MLNPVMEKTVTEKPVMLKEVKGRIIMEKRSNGKHCDGKYPT